MEIFLLFTQTDTVRIQPKNQEIVAPDEEGFISTPTFDFGKVAISSNTQRTWFKAGKEIIMKMVRKIHIYV